MWIVINFTIGYNTIHRNYAVTKNIYSISMATENSQWSLRFLINLRIEAGPTILVIPLYLIQK